jgi:hypothetical protein
VYESSRWSTRAGYCASRFDNANLEARVHEADLGARVGHAWDLSWLTLELGAGGALVGLFQKFETDGSAPPRRALGGSAGALVAALSELRRGFYLGLDVEAQIYVLRLLEGVSEPLRAQFAGRSALVTGRHF